MWYSVLLPLFTQPSARLDYFVATSMKSGGRHAKVAEREVKGREGGMRLVEKEGSRRWMYWWRPRLHGVEITLQEYGRSEQSFEGLNSGNEDCVKNDTTPMEQMLRLRSASWDWWGWGSTFKRQASASEKIRVARTNRRPGPTRS